MLSYNVTVTAYCVNEMRIIALRLKLIWYNLHIIENTLDRFKPLPKRYLELSKSGDLNYRPTTENLNNKITTTHKLPWEGCKLVKQEPPLPWLRI